ncbi:hypothetical protein Tco_0371390 [Tanacetum coccineum]
MSSSSSHATVTYTFVSTDNDLLPWGFHLMEADEPEAPDDTEAPPSHPLPADASPTVDSPGYIADSEPIKDDFEEDPKMDPVDYVADEEEEESSDDDDEEEEHLSAATPSPHVSPQTIVPFSQTKLRRARIYVQPRTPPSPSAEARIAEYASSPTPPPSPLSPLSSPPLLLPPTRPQQTSPTYASSTTGL